MRKISVLTAFALMATAQAASAAESRKPVAGVPIAGMMQGAATPVAVGAGSARLSSNAIIVSLLGLSTFIAGAAAATAGGGSNNDRPASP